MESSVGENTWFVMPFAFRGNPIAVYKSSVFSFVCNVEKRFGSGGVTVWQGELCLEHGKQMRTTGGVPVIIWKAV